MGNCFSTAEVSEEDKLLHRKAEKELKETKAKLAAQVKVLLLGSGDSGKSTIVKQMRLLHNVPFTKEEVESYRQLVFHNIIEGWRALASAMETFELSVHSENSGHASLIDQADDIADDQPFPMHYLEPLKALWEDPNVQIAWRRGNEVALPGNLVYLFSNIDRFFDHEYIPSIQDILRCRARTTGIIETVFRIDTHELHLLDVGGQKSERRKWIHCFQGVTTILFLVALNGYDQCMIEDKETNQMKDALTVWSSICGSQWFVDTSIILFLNKQDLFRERVQISDIRDTFPNFKGPSQDTEAGQNFFRDVFLAMSNPPSQNRARERIVYAHFTNATDTALLKRVLVSVEDVTFRSNLAAGGLV